MTGVTDGFGFYAVLTDPAAGYERLTELAVSRGVAFVQLRMKDAAREQVVSTAKAMKRIAAGSVTRLIINDDPTIAAEVGADGVHLGQGDMSYEEARGIVGPDAIIGLSTHNPAQTRAACALKPDYIGVGPVFATPTKKAPDPVIGVEGMRAMLAHATAPAVAIGGITIESLPELRKAGARNFCMVRPFTQAGDPGVALDRILEAWQVSG